MNSKIWEYLPKEVQEKIKYLYKNYKVYNRTSNEAVRDILELIFDKANLTSNN